jgi:hypothetical protein
LNQNLKSLKNSNVFENKTKLLSGLQISLNLFGKRLALNMKPIIDVLLIFCCLFPINGKELPPELEPAIPVNKNTNEITEKSVSGYETNLDNVNSYPNDSMKNHKNGTIARIRFRADNESLNETITEFRTETTISMESNTYESKQNQSRVSSSSSYSTETNLTSTTTTITTTERPKKPPRGEPDKSNISHLFSFIVICSAILFCLVGIDPQQDLHLEQLDIN